MVTAVLGKRCLTDVLPGALLLASLRPLPDAERASTVTAPPGICPRPARHAKFRPRPPGLFVAFQAEGATNDDERADEVAGRRGCTRSGPAVLPTMWASPGRSAPPLRLLPVRFRGADPGRSREHRATYAVGAHRAGGCPASTEHRATEAQQALAAVRANLAAVALAAPVVTAVVSARRSQGRSCPGR